MNPTSYEIVIIVWAVRIVGALAIILGLLAVAIRVARLIARRTQTLGYLWRAAWGYARADYHQREALRAKAQREMPRVPGLRDEDDDA